MAAKPYHAGHDGLVRIASMENDVVKLFVSTGDRKRPGEITILGKDMLKIWTEYLEPSLPSNVEVEYAPSPIGMLFKTLEAAEAAGSRDTYVIYSDPEDILKYKDETLRKAAKDIFNDERIERRSVDRSETVNISGTAMRQLLQSGDMKKFISLLPPAVKQHGEEIYNVLRKPLGEALLRSYIALIVK